MQYEIPKRGQEYPASVISVDDSHHRIQYLNYLYAKGVDWDSYAKKLAKKNNLLVMAEKAMLETVNYMPVVAALVIPLAYQMSLPDMATKVDASVAFQSIVPDELELHEYGILDIHQRFQNLGALEKVSLKIAPPDVGRVPVL